MSLHVCHVDDETTGPLTIVVLLLEERLLSLCDGRHSESVVSGRFGCSVGSLGGRERRKRQSGGGSRHGYPECGHSESVCLVAATAKLKAKREPSRLKHFVIRLGDRRIDWWALGGTLG